MSKLKKLTKKEVQNIFKKHSPSMIGVIEGYDVYPISSREAIYLKTKNRRFKEAFLLTLNHDKRIWKEATSYRR